MHRTSGEHRDVGHHGRDTARQAACYRRTRTNTKLDEVCGEAVRLVEELRIGELTIGIFDSDSRRVKLGAAAQHRK